PGEESYIGAAKPWRRPPDWALFRAGDEFLKPWVLAQRIEAGIDFQPAGREVVRDLEQRLELVERLLRLAHENVDAHELVLVVRAADAVLRHRTESDPTLTFPDRFFFPTEVCQRHAELDVARRITGCRAKLLLEGLPDLFGVGTNVCGIALPGISRND